MARIAIIEDEILIADNIAFHLQALGHTPIGPANNFDAAIALFEREKPDMVLLDIRIKGEKSGLDIAKVIHSRFHFPFIFLTAFSDRATVEEAKLSFPAGYVRKPFSRDDLYVAIEMALNRVEKPKEERIVIKSGGQKEAILLNDILYLKADRVYVTVVMKLKTIVLRQSMKAFLSLLPKENFIRTHRSYAVNRSKVKGMTTSTVILDGEELPLGRKYQEKLLDWLQNRE